VSESTYLDCSHWALFSMSVRWR